MSRISVIIPNYNREHLVGETIQNMLDQSLPPDEIIVVDDGSSDCSVEVIRSFEPRVKLIQQTNQGPGAARNAGLKIATGDYIQFMDSDDLASHNKLATQVMALERENADFAYGPWAKVKISGDHLSFTDHVLQTQPLPTFKNMLEWFLSDWSIVLQSCLFRRTILEKAGQFNSDLMIWEDGEYFVRILVEHPHIAFTPDCLTLYRLHESGKLTESGSSQQRKLIDQAIAFLLIADILYERDIHLPLATQYAFSLEAWKLWKTMMPEEVSSQDTYRHIQKLWNFRPELIWILYTFMQRLMIHLHWRKTGSRWIQAYQSNYPAKSQITLVEQLGFECV